MKLNSTLTSIRPLFNVKYDHRDRWSKTTISVISPIAVLIDRVLSIVKLILHFGFNYGPKPHGSKYNTAIEFFGDVFNIVEKCGSGGPYYHTGWFSQLFVNEYPAISLFDECIAYVPFEDLSTGSMWYYASGLVYSIAGRSECNPHTFYRPHYGRVKHQVLSRDLFNELASK